ncbi:hypothetical protein BJY52DRAFT_1378901, partial [Lactarius psammicola]
RYSVHLSKEQVAELVIPHPATLKLVNSWPRHRGVRFSSVSVIHEGRTLKFTGVSTTQANALLDASYRLYGHVKANETIVRTSTSRFPLRCMATRRLVPTTYLAPRTLSGRFRTSAPAG